jgi:7,8-dihydropterin-6-yl-methyl-4-(beta-D-ribofuranosyl)aminobenzene 5'-phosphate synthase
MRLSEPTKTAVPGPNNTRSDESSLVVRQVDRVLITVVADNYYDAVRPDTPVSFRFRSNPGESIHAEHGLSYFVETTAAGEEGAFMFDFGLDADGLTNNIRLVKADLTKLNALALSHGHFDHWGGLAHLLEERSASLHSAIPLYVGKDAFAHRFSLRPSGIEVQDLGQLDRDEIERLGPTRIIETESPVEMVPGAYLTGNIERITDYEHVPKTLLIERNAVMEEDQFFGEQAVLFLVKDRGLVILSGCAHAGIVNTVKHAQKITGIRKVHAIMGGFHLVNADTDVIEATIADIKAFEPDYVIPTHCTGFEAIVRFKEEMGSKFLLNTAGTTYLFP